MRPIRPSSRGQPLWTALLAALVLLIQGLLPASAMPMPAGGRTTMQLCTHDGLQSVAVGDSAPAGDSGHNCCDHCVMATAMALPAAAPAGPIRYSLALRAAVGEALSPSTRARAPPRPPSQGPPSIV